MRQEEIVMSGKKVKKSLSGENLLMGAARLTNPEVLAAAERVADYIPDVPFLKSRVFLRIMSALLDVVRRNPNNQTLMGKILSDRLGKFGDYLFVKLSEAAAVKGESTIPRIASREKLRKDTSLKDRRITQGVLGTLNDESDPSIVLGAFVLIFATSKDIEKYPIRTRDFVLRMGDTAKAFGHKHLEHLSTEKELTEADALAEIKKAKKEMALAVKILAAVDQLS